MIAAANLVDLCGDRRDPGQAARRRRREDGREGRDPDLLAPSLNRWQVADQALRGRRPLTETRGRTDAALRGRANLLQLRGAPRRASASTGSR
ncbi:MAG: hypothetical protein MZW92_20455 [Comamonadaceae bacterium]|nr:hypothetical protein [Comamonadaceae bacterium]